MQFWPADDEHMCLKHVIGKSVPLQAWTGPEGSRKLRLPDFVTTAQDGGKVVSLTHQPLFTPRKYSWYSFLLEAASTPRALVQSDWFYVNEKSTDTSWGRTSDLPICSTVPCSKHVKAWNKLIVKQKFCVSSWLITEINCNIKLQLNNKSPFVIASLVVICLL